jgi:Circularly permutated YpsA SLOG family
MHTTITVISGGQTGVDQGALEAALLQGVAVGGFCPESRRDEHGPIPERYVTHLHSVERGGNLARTILNVVQADGTVLFYWQDIHGGTADTLRACLDYRKPFLPVDASMTNQSAAVSSIMAFLLRHSIFILNVAGPRISSWTEGFAFTRDVMTQVLRNLGPFSKP